MEKCLIPPSDFLKCLSMTPSPPSELFSYLPLIIFKNRSKEIPFPPNSEYPGPPSTNSKLFVLTTPTLKSSECQDSAPNPNSELVLFHPHPIREILNCFSTSPSTWRKFFSLAPPPIPTSEVHLSFFNNHHCRSSEYLEPDHQPLNSKLTLLSHPPWSSTNYESTPYTFLSGHSAPYPPKF